MKAYKTGLFFAVLFFAAGFLFTSSVEAGDKGFLGKYDKFQYLRAACDLDSAPPKYLDKINKFLKEGYSLVAVIKLDSYKFTRAVKFPPNMCGYYFTKK